MYISIVTPFPDSPLAINRKQVFPVAGDMPELSIQTILQVLSLGIIVLWTTRLARSKGLNPWLWGVGSVLLIALAWNFSPNLLTPVVIAPLIFLLLFRSPLFRRGKTSHSTPCPSCGAPETGGLNFCVQCGWDLSRSSSDSPRQGPATFNSAGMAETPVAEERAPEVSPVRSEGFIGAEIPDVDGAEVGDVVQFPGQSPVQSPAQDAGQGAEPEPAADFAPDVVPDAVAEPVADIVPDAAPDWAPEPVLAQETASEPVTHQALRANAEELREPTTEPMPAPEPQQVPATPAVAAPPAPRPIPTPANLTERGVSLFNQGRFQEAIDQFTKAIALDPDYKEAWERRAEAYGKLGRPERQKADQRRLEAF